MYGKVDNGELIKAPYYMKKDGKEIFGYNREDNVDMLLEDGWKPVVETSRSENMISPAKSYVENESEINAVWTETYVEPVLTYAEKRAEAYPSPTEYLDAQVKIASGNLTLVAEGQLQLKAYVEECLAVKAKYPKPDAGIL